MMQTARPVIIAAIVGALFGSGSFLFWQKRYTPTSEELIKEFYDVENAAQNFY